MQNDTSLLFKNPDSIVSKEDPWCDDLLDRKHIAKLLTNIISSLTQPFVIGIDSSFGSGKTFFIKRWAEELKNNDANVIYFNAWESDFSDDPLMAYC